MQQPAMQHAHYAPMHSMAPQYVLPYRMTSAPRRDGVFALAASLLLLAVILSGIVAMEGGIVHKSTPTPAATMAPAAGAQSAGTATAVTAPGERNPRTAS
jgi:hypothetical protein